MTLDAGGGQSSAPGVIVEGTIGQTDADVLQPSLSGGYELTGGYWVGMVRPPAVEAMFADGFA